MTKPTRIFFTQSTLDRWIDEGRAHLEDTYLKVNKGEHFNTTLRLTIEPAFKFLRTVSGNDEQQLVGKVKSGAQIDALGGDRYANSVLMGETAYDLQEGWLAATAVTPDEDIPTVKGSQPEHDKDIDLLARLLNTTKGES